MAKKTAKFITRESWSRCDTPSMLYDAVRNPYAVYQPQAAVLTVAYGLKQEKSKRFEPSHESYGAATQVGKYIFFVLIFPVYVCCYSIPHWVFTKALPYLFRSVKKQAYTLSHPLIEMGKKTTSLMKKFPKHIIRNSLKMIKQQVKISLKHLMGKLSLRLKKIKSGPQRVQERIKGIKDSAAKIPQKIYKKAEKRVLDRNARMKQKARDRVKKLTAVVVGGMNRVKQTILKPIIMAISRPFSDLFNLLRIVKKLIFKHLKIAAKLVKKITHPWILLLKKNLKIAIQNSKNKVKKGIQPIANKLKVMRLAIGRFFQQVKRALKPMTAYVTKISLKIKNVLAGEIKKVKQPIIKVVSPLKPFLGKLQRAISQGSRQVVKIIVSVIAPIAFFLKKWIKKDLVWLQNSIMKPIKAVKSKVQQLVSLPRQGVQSSVQKIKKFASASARIIFLAQVVIAVINVSFTDGFKLVKETVQPYNL